MSNVKVGIIGCGWFGNVHIDNLKKIEGVEIAALVSTNPEKLQKTGEKADNARLYSDYSEMFEKEKCLDAVFICVPPDRHENAEFLAAQRGIHIYAEKPIEVSLEKAFEVEKAILGSGIITSVGYQERYNSEIEKIKAYIENKKIGIVSGRWLEDIPGAPWWRRKERSGGQVVEQCTHIFDMLRYFFGEAKSVFASAGKGIVKDVKDYNLEDFSSTIITFKNGIVANILTACYLEGSSNLKSVGFELICSDSIIQYDWNSEVRYMLKNETKTIPFKEDSHYKAVEVFIEAVKSGNREKIKSDYSDGLKTFKLTLAANDSIASGMPVYL